VKIFSVKVHFEADILKPLIVTPSRTHVLARASRHNKKPVYASRRNFWFCLAKWTNFQLTSALRSEDFQNLALWRTTERVLFHAHPGTLRNSLRERRRCERRNFDGFQGFRWLGARPPLTSPPPTFGPRPAPRNFFRALWFECISQFPLFWCFCGIFCVFSAPHNNVVYITVHQPCKILIYHLSWSVKQGICEPARETFGANAVETIGKVLLPILLFFVKSVQIKFISKSCRRMLSRMRVFAPFLGDLSK